MDQNDYHKQDPFYVMLKVGKIIDINVWFIIMDQFLINFWYIIVNEPKWLPIARSSRMDQNDFTRARFDPLLPNIFLWKG